MGSMNMHYLQRILNLSTGAVVARSSQFMRHVSHRPFPNKPPDYRTLYTLIVDLVGVVLCIVYAWCLLGRRPPSRVEVCSLIRLCYAVRPCYATDRPPSDLVR